MYNLWISPVGAMATKNDGYGNWGVNLQKPRHDAIHVGIIPAHMRKTCPAWLNEEAMADMQAAIEGSGWVKFLQMLEDDFGILN